MKPLIQNRFPPDGNCLMTCAASILEEELENLPEDSNWKTLQLALIERKLKYRRKRDSNPPSGYSIAFGPSPRGTYHACVALNGEIIHDPHPDNIGLLTIHGYAVIEPI